MVNSSLLDTMHNSLSEPKKKAAKKRPFFKTFSRASTYYAHESPLLGMKCNPQCNVLAPALSVKLLNATYVLTRTRVYFDHFTDLDK